MDGLNATHSPTEIPRTMIVIRQLKWLFHVTVLIFIYLYNKHIVYVTFYREVKWSGVENCRDSQGESDLLSSCGTT